MTQSTTLADIRERVRLRLDDDSFEADVIDRAISDYQKELTNNNAFMFMETEDDVTLTQGTVQTALPADCQHIVGLVLRSPLAYRTNLTKAYIDWDNFITKYPTPDLETSGAISAWTIYSNNLNFAVPADQEYTLRVYYTRPSEEMADDNDICDVPDEYAEILVIGAVIRIQQRDDDYEVSTYESQRQQAILSSLVKRYGRGAIKGGPKRMMSSFRG